MKFHTLTGTVNAVLNRYVNPLFSRQIPFPPYHIDIEPTTRCNLRCSFCQVPGWKHASKEDLSCVRFQEITAKCPGLLSVKLQGMGEPFLNPDIVDMIAYCNRKRIRTRVVTNGTVLSDSMIERLFQSPPTSLCFSLDTLDPDVFEEMRGRPLHSRLIHNLQRSAAENRATGHHCRVEIWSLIGKQNVTCIDGILAFAAATGVDNVVLNTKITGFAKAKLEQGNRGMAIDDWRSIKALSPASRQRLRRAGIGLEIAHGSDFHFPDKPCYWIRKHAYVCVDGEVVPCCLLADPDTISFGNIFKARTMLEIWNNDKYCEFRHAILAGRIPQICRECYETVSLNTVHFGKPGSPRRSAPPTFSEPKVNSIAASLDC